MRLMGVFSFSSEEPLFHGTRVILRTSRGQEAGTILCKATKEAVAAFPPGLEENNILRVMTQTDEAECRQIQSAEGGEYQRAKEIIAKMNLGMDLVRVEHIYGGERLIIYYVAEGRVDFRELVRLLASEFQTRIEMRQIGVRDETKLLADIGDCGREVCCNAYLISMPPVSMKMAKLQKATLDPTKISGRCGRLKCCLRYEYDVYTERLALLPPIGTDIQTPAGHGVVIGQELLAKRLLVELEDRTRKYFTLEEIEAAAADTEVFPASEIPEEDPVTLSENETPERSSENPNSGKGKPYRSGSGGKPPVRNPQNHPPKNRGSEFRPSERTQGHERRSAPPKKGFRPDTPKRFHPPRKTPPAGE